MSFLPRTATSATRPPVVPRTGTLRDDAEQPGRYLTDGISLYRHVGIVSSGMGQMVGLENCRTLDVVLLPIGELHRRHLRPVTPTRTA